MIFDLKTLTKDKLAKLKSLVKDSLEIDTNIKWSQKNGYNADNTFLPVRYNKELATFVNSITGYNLKDITSLHFIRYNKGQYLTRHKDEVMLDITNPPKSKSIIFLLEMSDEGGEFLLNDKDTNFNTAGQYISFDGQATYHEVREVKKGTREVLVLWYRPETVLSLM